jgi:4-aminobutyrate aminotransferase/(S)-3-amino-2-methylpropionate transaminase
MIELIKQHDLVSHTAATGISLANELKRVFSEPEASGKVFNFRGEGSGTFLSWDLKTPAMRDDFVGRMRRKGVQIGGCGERAVRLRPMLTFGETHLAVLCGTIEEVLREM